MQQHIMQLQQPMMAAYASQNQVTTDIIQQYLDENKQLILAILDNQNAGKAEQCAENQAKLQRNLMYLAAIADTQTPQVPIVAQHPPNAAMQSGARHMQCQPMSTSQSLLAARSSMMYVQSPLSALQKQQQLALHSQVGVSSGAKSGFNVLHGETSFGGNGLPATRVFADFARRSSKKEEGGNALSADGSDGNSGGQGAANPIT